MAWTEECKIAFKNNADHQIWTQKGGKNITAVLKKLSKESDIPFKTLERWYYEKEKKGDEKLNALKNEGNTELNNAALEVIENIEEKKEESEKTSCYDKIICIMCNKNPNENYTCSLHGSREKRNGSWMCN